MLHRSDLLLEKIKEEKTDQKQQKTIENNVI